MKIIIARIVERNEDTDVATGNVWDNMADNAAYDCAHTLYVRALKAGNDVYYTVEMYEVDRNVPMTHSGMVKLANSLNYTV